MSDEYDGILKVGDMAEFLPYDSSVDPPEWKTDRVEEIHIVEEYDEKQGRLVRHISWRNIREYTQLVVVIGTNSFARNEQVRPLSKPMRRKRRT